MSEYIFNPDILASCTTVSTGLSENVFYDELDNDFIYRHAAYSYIIKFRVAQYKKINGIAPDSVYVHINEYMGYSHIFDLKVNHLEKLDDRKLMVFHSKDLELRDIE